MGIPGPESGLDLEKTYRWPLDQKRMVVLEPHRIYLERSGSTEDYHIDFWSLLGGVFRLRSGVLKAKDQVAYLWDKLEFGQSSTRHPWAGKGGVGLAVVWFIVTASVLPTTDAGLLWMYGGALAIGVLLPLLIRRRALVIKGLFTRIVVPWMPETAGFERFVGVLRDRVLYWDKASLGERLAASGPCLVNWEQTDAQRGILALRHRSSAHDLPPVCVCTGEPAETLFPSSQSSGTDIGFLGFSAVFRLYLPMKRRAATAARVQQRVYGIAAVMGPLIFTLGFAALTQLPGTEDWDFWSWQSLALLALFSLVWARVWARWRRVLPVYIVEGGLKDSSLTLGFGNRRALEKVLEVCVPPEEEDGENKSAGPC